MAICWKHANANRLLMRKKNRDLLIEAAKVVLEKAGQAPVLTRLKNKLAW